MFRSQDNKEFGFALSNYEKKLYHCTKYGDCLVIGVAIIQGKNKNLTTVLVKKALNIIKNRHPLLRAYLEYDSLADNVYLICKNENNLDDVELECINISSRDRLTSELEQFNSKIIDYDRKCLLWRFKVIKFVEDSLDKYALAIVIPLFLTDGINISAISIEIVNVINSLITSNECEEMRTKLDVIENLHVLTSKYKLISEKKISHVNLSNINSFVLPDKFKCFREKGLKINLIRVNKELTKKLVKLSKEKKCKLTGFLNACIIYALRELYLENGLKFPNELSCGIPANLRLRYKPNLDFSHIRFQVCMTRYNLSSPQFGEFKDIWSDANYINKQIEKSTNIEDGSLFMTTHNNESIKEVKIENDLLKLREENHFDLILSNIGTHVYDRKKQAPGPFQIKELYHGDSLTTAPNIISALIFHVCNWNDELQILLSANKHSIGSFFVNRLIYLFEKHLINIPNYA